MTFYRKWPLAAIFGIAIIVIFSPGVDQYIAAASYNSASRTFYGESALWCQNIYALVPIITATIVLIPLVWLLLAHKKHKIIIRFGLTIYLALILGPGLIVNVIFKDHWGRPRPYQVLRDGKQYSPLWSPHFSEKKDNSFPGGHAAIGFFMGIPFLVLGRKLAAVMLSLIGGVSVGIVRILQGGHYLSDILFSGIFVWLSAGIVIYLVSNWYKKATISD